VLRAVPDLRRPALHSASSAALNSTIQNERPFPSAACTVLPTHDLGQTQHSAATIFSPCFIHCRHSPWFLPSLWPFNIAFLYPSIPSKQLRQPAATPDRDYWSKDTGASIATFGQDLPPVLRFCPGRAAVLTATGSHFQVTVSRM